MWTKFKDWLSSLTLFPPSYETLLFVLAAALILVLWLV